LHQAFARAIKWINDHFAINVNWLFHVMILDKKAAEAEERHEVQHEEVLWETKGLCQQSTGLHRQCQGLHEKM